VERTTTKPGDYIKSLPEEVRADMEELDAAISSVMAGRSKTMWEGKLWGGSDQSIIGYGDFSYQRPTGVVEWFMVGLARQKNYLSVYVNAADDDGYLLAKYADRLGKVKTGAASISFRSLEDINMDVLLELLEKAERVMSASER
jgi:hypothetical protein